MKFKIIDPKGLHIDGKHHGKGAEIEGEAKTARISTPLHFKQIEAVIEAEKSNKIEVSEAAEKLAKENKIDLTTVKGTGKDGAIVKSDVEAAIDAAK